VDSDTDPGAVLDAWRARGDHRFDPVRFRFIEALARRAAAHHGDVRHILDDRLAGLLAAYGEDLDKAQGAQGSPGGPPPRGPLAELVDHLARHAPDPGGELKALKHFRRTWSRLSADRRLTQSLAKVPDQAGPLNSNHLVHRSLTLMRELSPEYLHRFMAHVDVLLWMDQAHGGAAAASPPPPRADKPKKSARVR